MTVGSAIVLFRRSDRREAGTPRRSEPGHLSVSAGPRDCAMPPDSVTDPALIEAIETAFMLAIYRAELMARRRFAGLVPPPRRPVRLPPRLAEAVRSVGRVR
jgi:hypothetical protein